MVCDWETSESGRRGVGGGKHCKMADNLDYWIRCDWLNKHSWADERQGSLFGGSSSVGEWCRGAAALMSI